MNRTLWWTLSAVLLGSLVACKPGAQQAANTIESAPTAAITTAAPDGPLTTAREDPLVKAAQTIINQTNQGRACTSLNTKRKLTEEEPLESADFDKELENLPQFKTWSYLARRGVAQRRSETAKGSGTPFTTFVPDLTLTEDQGKGLYIETGSGLLYCYGRWTVTSAEPTDKFTPTLPDRQALSTTVVLSGAPSWATTDPAAVILNRPNSLSEKDDTLLVAIGAYDKPTPAVLNAPNTIWVQVPKE